MSLPHVIETTHSDGINQLLKISQQRIIHQVAKKKQLIRAQLFIVVMLGIAITLHLIPFLFIDRTPRIFATGIIIIIGFNNNISIQLIRKKKLINETQQFLKKIKDSKKLNRNGVFFPLISNYLHNLYNLLFYGKKKNKLPESFFLSTTQEYDPEIEEGLIKSLNNDIFINLSIGFVYILAAVLAGVFMPERIQIPFYLGSLIILISLFIGLWIICLKLRHHLSSWIRGFMDLQIWVKMIENLPIKSEKSDLQNPVAYPTNETALSDTKIARNVLFCPFCGEADQLQDKFCQNCGKLIE
ncbi:zinc ribbon domain-containing protein [Promethearchaeum syntrophicum]|uniref:Zinc ribbon domain-containing protein n=1 Tax=Promethearchaeum syntrophicum TaxID=2594042 RepID=A0A5B9DA08_9ARCH|nr:zinc ribbon domain-containing protein [Candidatus Prometheoarchaeum syntrophicum]QEE15933.1 hypothetical protein DSAG12_01760 [Candidatus Prometheoarchaeum syntrophicum]